MNGARIIVIGGGFAGVAAAATLHARGALVTLLEARLQLGGRARSDVLDGVTFDVGAQLITTSYTRTRELLDPSRRTAPDAPLRRTTTGDAYVRAGERLPLRFGSVRSLLAFAGLGPAEKVRLAAFLLPLLARHHAALDADGSRLPASLDADDARRYIEAHVGARAADVLVEPACSGFFALAGHDVSLAFFLTLGRYGSEGDVLAPAHGWSGALAAAIRGAHVELGTTALIVERDAAGGVAVHDAAGRIWHADGVVIATGPRHAAAILAPIVPPPRELAQWLADVPLRRTWTLALVIDRAPARDAFGVFRDAGDARNVSACAVHGAKHDAAPADRDVVLAWPTPTAALTLIDAPAERIAAAMLPEVEAMIPEVTGHVRRARVYRLDEGTPIPAPGFAGDRARGRALADALAARHGAPIVLAGDYLATPLLEGAVASGVRAAEQVEAVLRAR